MGGFQASNYRAQTGVFSVLRKLAKPSSVGSFLKLRGALDGDAEFFEFAVEGGAGEAKDLSTAPNVT